VGFVRASMRTRMRSLTFAVREEEEEAAADIDGGEEAGGEASESESAGAVRKRGHCTGAQPVIHLR
jgi:hypothetical protein